MLHRGGWFLRCFYLPFLLTTAPCSPQTPENSSAVKQRPRGSFPSAEGVSSVRTGILRVPGAGRKTGTIHVYPHRPGGEPPEGPRSARPVR